MGEAAPKARMIMQVHNELVFEVREESVESARETIKQLMEHAIQLSVPLIVSIGVGMNWDEAH
jgi:DNA polymerase-1